MCPRSLYVASREALKYSRVLVFVSVEIAVLGQEVKELVSSDQFIRHRSSYIERYRLAHEFLLSLSLLQCQRGNLQRNVISTLGEWWPSNCCEECFSRPCCPTFLPGNSRLVEFPFFSYCSHLPMFVSSILFLFISLLCSFFLLTVTTEIHRSSSSKHIQELLKQQAPVEAPQDIAFAYLHVPQVHIE